MSHRNNIIINSYSSHKLNNRAGNLLNISEKNRGLLCDNHSASSIFTNNNRPPALVENLSLFTGVASAVISLAPALTALFKSSNSQGAAEPTTDGLKNAANSYEPEVLQKAYDDGVKLQGELDTSINIASNESKIAGEREAEANKQAGELEGTIATDTKALSDTKASVSGDKSSSSLTTVMNKAIAGVPRTVKSTDAKGNATDIPNPNYDTEVAKIRTEYQAKIDAAKKIEDSIPALEKALAEKQENLKTLKGLAEQEKTHKETADAKVKTLTAKKVQVASLTNSVKNRLDTITGVTEKKHK